MAEEAETSFWDVGSCRPLSPQPAGPPKGSTSLQHTDITKRPADTRWVLLSPLCRSFPLSHPSWLAINPPACRCWGKGEHPQRGHWLRCASRQVKLEKRQIHKRNIPKPAFFLLMMWISNTTGMLQDSQGRQRRLQDAPVPLHSPILAQGRSARS